MVGERNHRLKALSGIQIGRHRYTFGVVGATRFKTQILSICINSAVYCVIFTISCIYLVQYALAGFTVFHTPPKNSFPVGGSQFYTTTAPCTLLFILLSVCYSPFQFYTTAPLFPSTFLFSILISVPTATPFITYNPLLSGGELALRKLL